MSHKGKPPEGGLLNQAMHVKVFQHQQPRK
ncbi:hypothetical protein F915_02570, partial [Acinetobacter baumannii NIPH 70]